MWWRRSVRELVFLLALTDVEGVYAFIGIITVSRL